MIMPGIFPRIGFSILYFSLYPNTISLLFTLVKLFCITHNFSQKYLSGDSEICSCLQRERVRISDQFEEGSC